MELAAQSVRQSWQLPRGPIPNVVEILESHGIVVMRLPLGSTDVDAFSLPFRDRPIIVLGAEKNDRARSRFDASHELGHLVIHGERVWGVPEVERQAHQFAAAFLMPEEDIAPDLPDRADWQRLFALKRKWQVSLAALLMRARVLGRMSEGNYVTAVKVASARGWRRSEPVPLGVPEQPQLLRTLLHSSSGRGYRELLPIKVLDQLEGAVGA
jgi:Zn-dependent peptidase ImmA (M78 family)